jgi:predicted secreted protein
MASSAVSAIGTQLQRGDGASPEVFTAIPECTSISGPAETLEFVDITSHSSTGNFREQMVTFISPGTVTASMIFLPANATQQALVLDMHQRTLRNFRIVYPDAGAYTVAFAGYVSINKESSFDNVLRANLTITVTGAVTDTA